MKLCQPSQSNVEPKNSKRTVVDIRKLENLVKLDCPHCCQKSLSLVDGRWVGLAAELMVKCMLCDEIFSREWTSEKDDTGRGFEINRVAVLTSLQSGFGAVRHNVWCENMGIPGLHPKTFQKHAKSIYKETPFLRKKVFMRAASIVRNKMRVLDKIDYSDTDVIDVAVSYDATWLTRGHTSLIGVCSVIDVITGLVLDSHVLSTFCQKCQHKNKLKEQDPAAYDAWYADHIDKKECDVNFFGTSGMMEVHGARVLWGRSIEYHRMRYTTMLSDGDSKSYTALQQLQPYGPDTPVVKEECINHVGKRLGTALRNLVSDCSKRGITLGGRGKGRLTLNVIRKLQIYYSRAIRAYNSALEMQRAIMASLGHCFSTDDNPSHELCPPGIDSWCFFQSAIAKHEEPVSHKHVQHTFLDRDLLHKHLEPIYSRLSDLQLLRRCERKATQNANESLHSVIWARCPKDKFSSRPRVEHAVISAINVFNTEHTSQHHISQIFGVTPQVSSLRMARRRQDQRLYNSLRKIDKKEKLRAKKRLEAKRKLQQELEEAEGGPAYKAGAFLSL